MRETDSQVAGLEMPRPSAPPMDRPGRVHPITAKIARHSCRAYRKARRAYLRIQADFDRLDPRLPVARDRTCDAMVMIDTRSHDACLASLMAIIPGEGSSAAARTTNRGNHAVIVDGTIYLAAWDQDGGDPIPDVDGHTAFSDGHYRLFAVDLDNLVDLTPNRYAPAPAPPGTPSAAFPILAGCEWKVEYSPTAEGMAEAFEPSATLVPAEVGGGYFGFSQLGSTPPAGPTVREFIKASPVRSTRIRRPAKLRRSKPGRAAMAELIRREGRA